MVNELDQISQTHLDNCVIIIDDFKVPGRGDIAFDRYKNHECSYEYVKDKLPLIFSDPSIRYVVPKSTASRAKFVVYPNNKQKAD